VSSVRSVRVVASYTCSSCGSASSAPVFQYASFPLGLTAYCVRDVPV